MPRKTDTTPMTADTAPTFETEAELVYCSYVLAAGLTYPLLYGVGQGVLYGLTYSLVASAVQSHGWVIVRVGEPAQTSQTVVLSTKPGGQVA